MASGATHNAVTLATATGLSTALMAYTDTSFQSVVLFAAGCIAGIWLTPDLDQEGYNRIENKMRKSKNPFIGIFGNLYIIFWYPYAKLIPHRSWVSHMPVVGTIIRIAYLMLMTSMFLVVIGFIAPIAHDAIGPFWQLFAAVFEPMFPAFLGLVVADFMHWFMDRKWMRWANIL